MLFQNYPNPFNSITQINFQIHKESKVTLTVYNLMGREVALLLDELKAPGFYSVLWDGQDNAGLPAVSGIYYYKLFTEEFNSIRKMMLLK